MYKQLKRSSDPQLTYQQLYRIYRISQYTLGLIFIGSGLIPLLLSDPIMRLSLLNNFPFPVTWHEPLFYGLVLMDIICGIWIILKPARLIVILLILVVIGYTGTMTIFAPEIWQDPFSGMLKNFSIITLCWVMWTLMPEVEHV